MSYACFVKDVYECIKRYSADDAFSLSAFAEGPEALKPGHSGTQEYAVLRNDYASYESQTETESDEETEWHYS